MGKTRVCNGKAVVKVDEICHDLEGGKLLPQIINKAKYLYSKIEEHNAYRSSRNRLSLNKKQPLICYVGKRKSLKYFKYQALKIFWF